MSLSLKPFNAADPTAILEALQRDCSPDQIVSVIFRSEMHPARSMDERDQWLRFSGIIACPPVYEAFCVSSLPIEPPAPFYFATGLEIIGTIANLLTRGGVHQKFVDDYDAALALARSFVDQAVLGRYETAEAYSCRSAWCDWFDADGILNETVLFGDGGDWWLLAVTATD